MAIQNDDRYPILTKLISDVNDVKHEYDTAILSEEERINAENDRVNNEAERQNSISNIKADYEEFKVNVDSEINKTNTSLENIAKKSQSLLLNIIDYGAIVNTLCNTAIINALNETKHGVFIPNGSFNIKKINLTSKTNLLIKGNGESSILMNDDSCSSVTWDYGIQLTNCNNIVFENICFDGNKDVVLGDDQIGVANVYIDTCTNVYFKNCTFRNNWFGNIILKNSSNIYVDGNKFLNSDCGVLTAPNNLASNNIFITNNYFDGANKSEPISIFSKYLHKNVVITGNVIKNHYSGAGIGVRACDGFIISNNIIDNCSSGIHLDSYNDLNATNGIVTNNLIINSNGEGLICFSPTNVTISDNRVINSKTNGMYFGKRAECTFIASNLYICDNTVENSYRKNASETGDITASIWFEGLTNSIVKNNNFKNDITIKTHIALRNSLSIGNKFICNIGDNQLLVSTSYIVENTFKDNIGNMGVINQEATSSTYEVITNTGNILQMTMTKVQSWLPVENTLIYLPTTTTPLEVTLTFNLSSVVNISLPNCRWTSSPTLVANRVHEFNFRWSDSVEGWVGSLNTYKLNTVFEKGFITSGVDSTNNAYSRTTTMFRVTNGKQYVLLFPSNLKITEVTAHSYDVSTKAYLSLKSLNVNSTPITSYGLTEMTYSTSSGDKYIRLTATDTTYSIDGSFATSCNKHFRIYEDGVDVTNTIEIVNK